MMRTAQARGRARTSLRGPLHWEIVPSYGCLPALALVARILFRATDRKVFSARSIPQLTLLCQNSPEFCYCTSSANHFPRFLKLQRSHAKLGALSSSMPLPCRLKSPGPLMRIRIGTSCRRSGNRHLTKLSSNNPHPKPTFG